MSARPTIRAIRAPASSLPPALSLALWALIPPAIAGAIVALAYGNEAGIQTAGLLAAIAALVLLIAHGLRPRRTRLRLSRQFALIVGLVVGCVLLATVAGALLMFVSDHDAVMISVITLVGGAVAIRAGGLVASDVSGDVERIRDHVEAVGQGRRDLQLGGHSRDELGQLAGAVDGIVARLAGEEKRAAASERARRDLVAAASHDLRTPISALRLLVDALDDELVDEPTRRRYQRTMQTHVGAVARLIDDLFELTRIEAGDVSWSLEQVRLGELLDDTVEAMRASALARDVDLRAEPPDQRLVVRADAERLQRVLFNLIHNAIRHTPADGSVTVRASSAGELAQVEVRDTGRGVSETEPGRLFEPFYRGGGHAARHTDGAGLGLAISRAIVEAHGGRIWIEPLPRGTTVRFTLPVGEAPRVTWRQPAIAEGEP